MWDPNYSEKEHAQPLLGSRPTLKTYHAKAPGSSYRPKHSEPTIRQFNDIIFAIAFIITVAALISTSVVGFTRGQPSKLIPSDKWAATPEDRSIVWFQDSVAQAKEDRYILLGCLGISIVMGYLWIVLLKTFTKLFIYATLFVGLVGILATGVYMLTLGIHRSTPSLRVAAYVIFALAFILFAILIFLRKRVALTHALFEECCHGIRNNPLLVTLSLLITGVFAAFIVFWTASFFFLYSVPSDTFSEALGSYHFDTKMRYIMLFQVFGLYWVSAFISAVLQCTIAGTISHWYFSRASQPQEFGAPAVTSLKNSVTYSFGSLALGSLILSLFQMAQFLLSQASRSNANNRVVRVIISCLRCILSFFQSIIKFINRYAFIYMGMKGDGFFSSARHSQNLISRNYFDVAVVDVLGSFILFVGKVVGSALSTIFCMMILNVMGRPISVVSLVLVSGTAYWLFNLYSLLIQTGIDTVFVSYLFDMEINGPQSAMLIPSAVHRLLQEKTKNR